MFLPADGWGRQKWRAIFLIFNNKYTNLVYITTKVTCGEREGWLEKAANISKSLVSHKSFWKK